MEIKSLHDVYKLSSEPIPQMNGYGISPSPEKARCLLLRGQDHLLALALSWFQFVLPGVLPDVLLASLDRIELLSLDLAGLLDRHWHVTLALDSSDLGHV